MKTFTRSIVIIALAILMILPGGMVQQAGAADRENFSVTNLTVLSKIIGAGFNIASKAMTASTNWTLSKAESLCNMLSLTACGCGDSVIVPLAYLRTGDIKVVRNATDDTVSIKKYGGTGVSIATGKTAIVVYNGTNYVRVTADATH